MLSRGLMVESRTHPAVIIGGGSECTALSPPSIPWRGALEQGTEPPTAPHRSINDCPLLRVCVCVCVHCCVCALGWVNVEHEFRVWVTILGCMSLSLHLNVFPICYISDKRTYKVIHLVWNTKCWMLLAGFLRTLESCNWCKLFITQM